MNAVPGSQSAGPGDGTVGKGVVSVFQRRISGARWAAGGQTKSSVQQAEPPVADAKGDQRGMGQHSGVWSSAVSAVVWSLPQLYPESGGLHPPGSLDKCLGTSDAKGGTHAGAYLWWSCSADTAVLIPCADILGVSACQTCLL